MIQRLRDWIYELLRPDINFREEVNHDLTAHREKTRQAVVRFNRVVEQYRLSAAARRYNHRLGGRRD